MTQFGGSTTLKIHHNSLNSIFHRALGETSKILNLEFHARCEAGFRFVSYEEDYKRNVASIRERLAAAKACSDAGAPGSGASFVVVRCC